MSNEIKNHILNEEVLIFNLPTIATLPNSTYTHKETQKWTGGEVKFAPWRQYFNVFEKDWLLTYNTPFNVTNNTFGGRDSGNSQANIAMATFFNVAEGNSGTNSFNIWFAPPSTAGTPPDFNAATRYTWFDGRTGGSPIAGRFRIETAASMPAVLQLRSHATVSPSDWALVSEIDNTWGIYRAYELAPVKVISGDANGNFKAIGQLESTLPTVSGLPPIKVTSRIKVQNLTSERIEILPTASLPAASSDNDGRVIIEDGGVNSANLIIYKGIQRFKINQWVTF